MRRKYNKAWKNTKSIYIKSISVDLCNRLDQILFFVLYYLLENFYNLSIKVFIYK
jgi:hypothetical protein